MRTQLHGREEISCFKIVWIQNIKPATEYADSVYRFHTNLVFPHRYVGTCNLAQESSHTKSNLLLFSLQYFMIRYESKLLQIPFIYITLVHWRWSNANIVPTWAKEPLNIWVLRRDKIKCAHFVVFTITPSARHLVTRSVEVCVLHTEPLGMN